MEQSSVKGWVFSLLGALFFFYSFFQVNLMTSLNTEMLNAFQISAATLSIIGACFFYANVLCLLPAGILVDRYSVKKLMLGGIGIVVLGTLIFAFAPSIAWVAIGRFLAGGALSLGLIVCLKLASLWLPVNRMALASALIIVIGMIGGMVAQAPMTWAVSEWGWRGALVAASLLGTAIALILWVFIPEKPEMMAVEEKIAEETTEKNSVISSLKEVIKKGQNWYAGFFICFVNLPLAILGALFGSAYLSQFYGLSSIVAASATSMLFLGMIVGSPFFGWFSDFLKGRRLPMVIGTIFCLFFTLFLLYVSKMDSVTLHILFFAIGFASASQVLGYPMIAESNQPRYIGSATSLAALVAMGGGYGLGLPFVGYLIEGGGGAMEAYRHAFFLMPIGMVISLVLILLMKESYGGIQNHIREKNGAKS